MMELKVIGVESGSLVLVSDGGERFSVRIDETLQSQLRPRVHTLPPREKRVSPREIQAHIRSGLSAEEVAELTGAPLEHVQRFEGPVTAEREHIVASALSVRVYTSADPDPLEEGTPFGDVIRERLAALGAEGEQWSSWKEEDGWAVKLLFRSDEIDHDARWRFDPKKAVLSPLTPEATTLSQQGEIRPTLIPRLRAVIPAAVDELATRFDTDAFSRPSEPERGSRGEHPASGRPTAVPHARPSAVRTSDTEPQPALSDTPRVVSTLPRPVSSTTEQRERNLNDTADLLDALRRRRGERDHASSLRVREEPKQEAPTVEKAPEPERAAPAAPPAAAAPAKEHAPTGTRGGFRRGRTSMPSWDEIVFGARSDD
ncbi:septation protein SepH [Rathayibacter sp. ZW T2_19]|uniref:Septation protein SepH n=1 Tax=Rathayibacter rubneri TaxID=2950106 RepID=A0A9X2IU90_9MICO|nr:septation protein SepH [Rathayibacter rubneri]MCM6763333.1 septation protein SepH [Rathayibacter rubneri]